ncbi:MAG: hypothetical protein WB626_03905 [Bacteroidota bacterium]
MKTVFGEAERERIAAAVRESETATSGEIVPYVVAQSDDYPEAGLRGGAALGCLAAALVFLLRWPGGSLTLPPFVDPGLALLAGMAAGWLANAAFPPVRRFFAGAPAMERRTAQRAAEAFLAEEVFSTRGRTGVLLFVSAFERRVVVLGDTGINAKVRKGEWEEVVQAVTSGLKSGRAAEGLIGGIRLAAALLQRCGVRRSDTDTNELGDGLRSGIT